MKADIVSRMQALTVQMSLIRTMYPTITNIRKINSSQLTASSILSPKALLMTSPYDDPPRLLLE
jgi:hypothetical protein